MNWFKITQYARARKKEKTTATPLRANLLLVQKEQARPVVRQLSSMENSVELAMQPVKEIA